MSPSATGARRRITALFFNGWSPRTLAAATGIPEVVFTRTASDLARRTDPAMLPRIGEAYERLWNARPPAATEADRAEAQLLRDQHREAMKDQPWYRQPTLGAMIGAAARKKEKQQPDDA